MSSRLQGTPAQGQVQGQRLWGPGWSPARWGQGTAKSLPGEPGRLCGQDSAVSPPGTARCPQSGRSLALPWTDLGLTSDRAGCVGPVPRLWRQSCPSYRWAKLPGPSELPLRTEAGASRAQGPGGGGSWRPRGPLIPGRLPVQCAPPRGRSWACTFSTWLQDLLWPELTAGLFLAISGVIVANKMTSLDKERTRGKKKKDWLA